jgi:hypothetical protein
VPRGFRWAEYIRDDGLTRHGKLVDADQVADPARGWTPTSVTTLPLFPIKARPRRVWGTSPTTGRRGRTIVASTLAPLWTGAVNEFTIETNDGATDTIKVTFRKGERFQRVHP